MKHLKIFSFAVLVLLGVCAVVYAKANSTITVTNNTNFAVGDVILYTQIGSGAIATVTGNGNFTADISSALVSVKINTTVVPLDSVKTLTTSNGDQVKVTVKSSSISID